MLCQYFVFSIYPKDELGIKAANSKNDIRSPAFNLFLDHVEANGIHSKKDEVFYRGLLYHKRISKNHGNL